MKEVLMTNEMIRSIERELNVDEYIHLDTDTDNRYDVEFQKAYLVTVYVMKDNGDERAKFNCWMTPNFYANYINGEVEEYI